MLRRSLVVWLGLLVLAIANAGVREALITPSTGAAAGHVFSTVTLCRGDPLAGVAHHLVDSPSFVR